MGLLIFDLRYQLINQFISYGWPIIDYKYVTQVTALVWMLRPRLLTTQTTAAI